MTAWAPVFDPNRDPAWSDFVTLDVEVASPWATTRPAGLWDTDRWDDPDGAVWAGMEPNWASIRCDVTGWKMTRGRAGSLDRFDTGTCSVEAQNDTGWASWSDDPDPSVSLGLRPGRAVRVTATRPGAAAVVLWSGWLQRAQESYPAAGEGPPTVSLAAVDSLSRLALVDPLEGPETGVGESTNARLLRIADAAGWPRSRCRFDSSAVYVMGTYWTRNLLDEAQVTTDSEGGALYADRDGAIVSKSRDWLRTDPLATTVQATITNTGEGFCPTGIAVDGPDVSTVSNRVTVARKDGSPQTFDDMDSQGLYGVRSWQRLDYICFDEPTAGLLGRRRLALSAVPARRLRSIDLDPMTDPALWDFVLAVDFGWRLHVEYRHPSDAWGWSGDVHVHGVAHTVTPTRWTTTLRVEDASFWQSGSGWDTAVWNQDDWSTAPTRTATGRFPAWA